MIPFARISTYGNTAVAPPSIKRFRTNGGAIGILYSTGEFYVRGAQGFYGEFGIGTSSNTYTNWTLVRTNVKDCWMGANTTIVQLNDDTFFYSGLSLAVGLGATDSNSNKLWVNCTTKFSTLPSLNIQKLYIDDNSSMLLLDNKQVYAVGYNVSGSFGLGNSTTRTTFGLVASDVDIFRRSYRTTTILKGTSYYRAGINNSGMLGTGNTNALNTLTLLSNLAVTDVIPLAAAITLNVSNSNYSAGSLANGAFGVGSTSSNSLSTYSLFSDRPLPSTFISTAQDFNQGSTCGIIKCSDGLYATGINTSGRLGMGDAAVKYSYTLIPNTASFIPGMNDVVAGNNFTGFLWNNTTIFMSGALSTAFGFASNVMIMTQINLPQ